MASVSLLPAISDSTEKLLKKGKLYLLDYGEDHRQQVIAPDAIITQQKHLKAAIQQFASVWDNLGKSGSIAEAMEVEPDDLVDTTTTLAEVADDGEVIVGKDDLDYPSDDESEQKDKEEEEEEEEDEEAEEDTVLFKEPASKRKKKKKKKKKGTSSIKDALPKKKFDPNSFGPLGTNTKKKKKPTAPAKRAPTKQQPEKKLPVSVLEYLLHCMKEVQDVPHAIKMVVRGNDKVTSKVAQHAMVDVLKHYELWRQNNK